MRRLRGRSPTTWHAATGNALRRGVQFLMQPDHVGAFNGFYRSTAVKSPYPPRLTRLEPPGPRDWTTKTLRPDGSTRTPVVRVYTAGFFQTM